MKKEKKVNLTHKQLIILILFQIIKIFFFFQWSKETSDILLTISNFLTFFFFFFSKTLQGWPAQAFSWYNAILLSRVWHQQNQKRTGGGPSIKLSAKETLYPQLPWQLWETAISALCIIVHALRSCVRGRQRGRAALWRLWHICYCEPSAVLYVNGVSTKGHFPICCHEITLPCPGNDQAWRRIYTQFILKKAQQYRGKKYKSLSRRRRKKKL